MIAIMTLIPSLALAVGGFEMDMSMMTGSLAKQAEFVDIIDTLTISPTSENNGNVNTGSTSDKVFTLTGSGAEEISLSVTGSAYSLLSTTCGSNPFNLLTGTCTATVRYTAGTGVQTGELVADATNQSRWAVAALSGTGVNLNPPTTPVISVTPGNTQNVVALTSGGTGATSYDLLWGLSAGSHPNTITGATLPYTHTGRTNGTPYYYVLNAINANGTTASSEVSGTPALPGFTDNFTGSDATALATHDANWTSTTYGNVSSLFIYSNQVRLANYANAIVYYNGSTSDTSKATVKATSSTGSTLKKGIVIRAGSSSLGYAFSMYNRNGTNWTSVQLIRNNADVLDTKTSQTFAQNTDHAIKITASGTNPVVINCYIDDVLITTYSDSSASRITSGHPGIFMVDGGGIPADNYMDTWSDN